MARKIFQMPLRAVPAEFCDGLIFKQQESERLDVVKIVLMKKICRLRPLKKVEQHQPAAAAVGRVVLVFDEGAVEQAGGFTASGGCNPSAARFCVAGKQQHVAPCFFPRNNMRRPAGGFVAVVGQDKAGGYGQKSNGAHTAEICCKLILPALFQYSCHIVKII